MYNCATMIIEKKGELWVKVEIKSGLFRPGSHPAGLKQAENAIFHGPNGLTI